MNCNADLALSTPPHVYRTRTLAKDVVEVLKAEKIDNYIIYGCSYGTVWATVLYDEIQKQKLTLPKFLVLDGVAGRAFDRLIDYDFIDQWEKRKSEIDEKALTELSAKSLPFGFKEKTWLTYIWGLLSRGTSLEFGQTSAINFLVSRLNRLSFSA